MNIKWPRISKNKRGIKMNIDKYDELKKDRIWYKICSCNEN